MLPNLLYKAFLHYQNQRNAIYHPKVKLDLYCVLYGGAYDDVSYVISSRPMPMSPVRHLDLN